MEVEERAEKRGDEVELRGECVGVGVYMCRRGFHLYIHPQKGDVPQSERPQQQPPLPGFLRV